MLNELHAAALKSVDCSLLPAGGLPPAEINISATAARLHLHTNERHLRPLLLIIVDVVTNISRISKCFYFVVHLSNSVD